MKRIDWFWVLMGIAWLIASIVFFIAKKDWFIVFLFAFIGIMQLLKSYFQERMSIFHLYKKWCEK